MLPYRFAAHKYNYGRYGLFYVREDEIRRRMEIAKGRLLVYQITTVQYICLTSLTLWLRNV